MSFRWASVGLLLGCLPLAACGEGESGQDAAERPRMSSTASTSPSGSSSGPISPSPVPSGNFPGRLLFSRFDESSHTFISTHTSRPNGEDETEIPMPGPEGGGRWSRSGTHIAVMTALQDGRIGTAIITPAGEVERILDIPDDSLNLVCTVWSPDDKRLACEGWDDTDPSRTGIYAVRASDGGGLQRLTQPSMGTSDLPGDYAPDGSQVLFKRAAGEANGTLMVVKVTGDKPRRFSKVLVEDPGRYSPDGKSVLTSADGRILLLDDTGEVIRKLSEAGAYLFGPVWSPDGSRIAYSRATAGPFADIYTALPDGTDQRQVTSTPVNEIRVEWGK